MGCYSNQIIIMSDYPTLLSFDTREVPSLPSEMVGDTHDGCGYTHSAPMEWTDGEVEFVRDLKGQGYSITEIAAATGRTETSISIKLKRLGKTNEKYNDSHRAEKYEANAEFFNIVKPKTILDAYCGTERWWLNNAHGCAVVSNDYNNELPATYNLPAEKLVAKLYSEDLTFDLIDLDPFGSAYDCFDLSLRMAKKAIIVTFGEMGHKRWKRLDFVRSHYGIDTLSDFTTERLIDEFRRIGHRHHKDPVPIIVKEWPRISRVYFELRPMKVTEQWKTINNK